LTPDYASLHPGYKAATGFTPVTDTGGNCFSLDAFRLMVRSRNAGRFHGATVAETFQ
jgi:hypothetical protein